MMGFIKKVVLFGVLALSVSLVACKSDEEKCEEGDLAACLKVAFKSIDEGVAEAEEGLGGMDEGDMDEAIDALGSSLDKALEDANREFDKAMQDADREFNKAVKDLDNALNSLSF